MKPALIQDDQACADDVSVNDDGRDVDNEVSSDEDDEVRPNVVVTSEVEGGSSSRESEQITALKLQLEIAKLQLQKAQLGQSSGQTTVAQGQVDRFDLTGIKSRLPVMSQNCDVLSFFTGFECTLQINAVPNDM
jgi:hypothetical protein